MRGRERVILWPVYFDSTKTRSEGRRVPKRLAVPAPKLSDLQRAVQKLELEFEVVPDAAYPRSPWRRAGCISVHKDGSKSRLLKDIVQELLKNHS